MHIRKTLMVLLVSLSLTAAADFVTVEQAYEVALSDLKVPVASTASLIFKECANCETKHIRMTHDTQFIVNGKSVGLRKFRKNVFQVRERKSEIITITHHLQTDTVTSLSLTR